MSVGGEHTAPPDSPLGTAALVALRRALPALRDCTYLNAGTLGPMPDCAAAAIAAEHAIEAGPRQRAGMWERLDGLQWRARRAAAALVGAEPGQVALMHSTHAGLNTCIWGLGLRAGDEIVTLDEEHPGLLVPLRHACDRLGCTVRVAPWCDDGDALVAGVANLVTERTRAIAISHVSWLSGRTAPIARLRATVPSRVRLIVDGAQSAAVLAVSPADGWDAYTISGQKWPCGPTGSGALVLRDPEGWLPTFGSYPQLVTPADPRGSRLHADGRRLETGTEAAAPLAGFAAAAEWIVAGAGHGRARQHAAALNRRARAALAGMYGVQHLHGHDHLLCIDVTGGSAAAVADDLLRGGVLTRWLTPDRLRVGLGAWTSEQEVDCLADRLASALTAAGGSARRDLAP